jgi:anti-sigma-K factor RskA
VNCEQADELIGAYALDALPHDEAAAMTAHLATCADHRAGAAELRAVATAMPALADAREAPPALRSRIMDAVAREPQVTAERSAPRAIASAPSRASATQRLQWPRANMMWGALAAALLIGFMAMTAWNIVLQRDDGDSAPKLAATADAVAPLRSADGTVVGSVLYYKDEKQAVIVADGLEEPGDGKTYQMWAIDAANNARSIGLIAPTGSGHGAAVVDFDRDVASTFAVTVERAGGVDQPTSDPVLVAQFSG